jgi:hypothetical protein
VTLDDARVAMLNAHPLPWRFDDDGWGGIRLRDGNGVALYTYYADSPPDALLDLMLAAVGVEMAKP